MNKFKKPKRVLLPLFWQVLPRLWIRASRTYDDSGFHDFFRWRLEFVCMRHLLLHKNYMVFEVLITQLCFPKLGDASWYCKVSLVCSQYFFICPSFSAIHGISFFNSSPYEIVPAFKLLWPLSNRLSFPFIFSVFSTGYFVLEGGGGNDWTDLNYSAVWEKQPMKLYINSELNSYRCFVCKAFWILHNEVQKRKR